MVVILRIRGGRLVGERISLALLQARLPQYTRSRIVQIVKESNRGVLLEHMRGRRSF